MKSRTANRCEQDKTFYEERHLCILRHIPYMRPFLILFFYSLPTRFLFALVALDDFDCVFVGI